MEIVKYPADILRQKTVPVTEFDKSLLQFTEDMIATMIAGRGIGLAAPQVGSLLSVFVLQVEEGKPLVFINPEITGTSVETVPYEEGYSDPSLEPQGPPYQNAVRRFARPRIPARV